MPLTYGALCALAEKHNVTITENMRAFVRAVEEEDLRAQADARPAFYAADDLELPIKNDNGSGRIFVSNEPFAGCSQAFYTHPEASAPGLSEEDRRILMESSTELARHGNKQHAMAIASFLTRASAATVAEPSAGEEIHVNAQGDDVFTLPLQPTGMETPRFVVHVPAAEEAPNRRADELEAFKAYNPLGYKQMDGLLVWRAACAWQRAAQQQAEPKCTECGDAVPKGKCYCRDGCVHEIGYSAQRAEPGADELWSLNVELGAALSEARPPKLSREQTTALLEMVNTALSTGAAQSGQRAGVAERVYPDELSDALRHVLGFPNFKCSPFAHLMRDAGVEIKRKAEDEQATVLHWLVKLVLDHGDKWAAVAESELKEMREKAAATQEAAQ